MDSPPQYIQDGGSSSSGGDGNDDADAEDMSGYACIAADDEEESDYSSDEPENALSSSSSEHVGRHTLVKDKDELDEIDLKAMQDRDGERAATMGNAAASALIPPPPADVVPPWAVDLSDDAWEEMVVKILLEKHKE